MPMEIIPNGLSREAQICLFDAKVVEPVKLLPSAERLLPGLAIETAIKLVKTLDPLFHVLKGQPVNLVFWHVRKQPHEFVLDLSERSPIRALGLAVGRMAFHARLAL